MNTKQKISISVRSLVEFVLRSGDLSSGYQGSSRYVEGQKAHQFLQNQANDEYTSEVAVSFLALRGDTSIEINGRIDGVIKLGGRVIIDEIKSTAQSVESIEENYNAVHWAQAKCYAFIYAERESLDRITLQLTYFQLETKEIKRFVREYEFEELTVFFWDMVDKYLLWANKVSEWHACRDSSIRELTFPFKNYRKGQRELAAAVYRAVRDGGRVFAQAPTGIGKTMATLFPTVKAMGEGLTSKIFYLTAKTITRTIAENTLDNMRKSGLRIKSITITAKDKICLNPGSSCDPEFCEYARGYYDRLGKAMQDIFRLDSITRSDLEQCAKGNRICPFELSLDLSLWCDCIICDYNYAFDPRVYLKRYFMESGGDYTFLIDEAHNLVDRGREMYSAELHIKNIVEMRREIADEIPAVGEVLEAAASYMIDSLEEFGEEEEGYNVSEELPHELLPLLRNFARLSDEWLLANTQSHYHERLLELYFEVLAFVKASEFFDHRYVTYFEKQSEDIKIKLYCLDPSYLLGEAMGKSRASVLFSATLTPLEYFKSMLGGDRYSTCLRLSSPFPRENLCLLVNSRIQTTYKLRESSYDRVVKAISGVVGSHTGNYLAYFPSYKYMMEVYIRFSESYPDVKTLCQKPGMTEWEKENFISAYSEFGELSLIGFAVMGGSFGEGIDLTGERLSGAVIVGVGLPQICLEREIIRKYFDEERGNGFEYSYVYPGMNKVMQAVGRVIRTEEDKGVVLLIDERFSSYRYRELYPPEWNHAVYLKGTEHMKDILEEFWED